MVVEPEVVLGWPVHFPDLDISTNMHSLHHLDPMEYREGRIYLHFLCIFRLIKYAYLISTHGL